VLGVIVVVAALAPVYEAERAGRPGMPARSPAWWHKVLDRAPRAYHVVAEGAGGPEGYASYTVDARWGEAGPAGDLHVAELVASTGAAHASLHAYLLGVDLVRRVVAPRRPPDDPLPWLLADPRAARRVLGDGVWLRVLDPGAALGARRYAAEVDVVLDLADGSFPAAAGRWRVEGGPDGARCARTDRPADLVLGPAELGAAYLGDASFEHLARAGRVEEATPGAAARAAAAFRWDPAPWAVTWF
jgi:predicted acetyltransferase